VILFANRSSWRVLSVRTKHTYFCYYKNYVLYRNFIWMFWSFSKSFICFLFGSLLVCLCMLLLAYARSSGVRSLLLRIFRVQRSSARQVHTLIILFNTQFLLCISFTLKDCMSRIGNMWLCFVVHVVGTYDLWSPREYSLCHILLSHARRRGLVCVIHASCER
jgi:hypothetical protein